MKTDHLEQFQKKKKLHSQLSLVAISLIAIYMVTAISETIWQNYNINKEIVRLKNEITELREQGQALRHLIAYRGTESFKEREARRKLGYKKPGEQVLAIPYSNLNSIESGQTKEAEIDQDQKNLTNPQKWAEYIFG